MYLQHFAVVVVLSILGTSSATHYDIKGWTLHQLVPGCDAQVEIIKTFRDSNSGVIFWNGIGGVGDPVDIVSSAEAFEHFEELLKDQQQGKFDYDKYIKVRLVASDVNIEIDNATIKTTVIHDHHHHDDSADDSILTPNLIPMRRIKDTSLYSGIFYTVRMPVFPSALVTWTSKETSDGKGNYVQIDSQPENLPFYKRDEKWYDDVQWALIPSEVEGYYTITLKGDLSAMVSSIYEKELGYNHVALAKSPDLIKSIRQGGALRDSALWRPKSVPSNTEVNEYQLKVKGFPEDTSTVTWTSAVYRNHSHFIQVSTNPDHLSKYQPGGEWFNDTFFHFDPTEIKLHGRISNLDLKIKEVLSITPERKIIKKFRLRNNHPNKVNYLMRDKIMANSRVQIQLDDDEEWAALMEDIQIDAILPHLSANKFQTNLKANHNPSTNPQPEVEVSSEYNLKSNIEVAPETTSEITIYVDQVNNVEIPFEAIMAISGTTDRIGGDLHSVRSGNIPGDLVRDVLLNSGQVQESLVPKESVIPNGVLIRVTGTFKGGFTVDGGVQAESVVAEIKKAEIQSELS